MAPGRRALYKYYHSFNFLHILSHLFTYLEELSYSALKGDLKKSNRTIHFKLLLFKNALQINHQFVFSRKKIIFLSTNFNLNFGKMFSFDHPPSALLLSERWSPLTKIILLPRTGGGEWLPPSTGRGQPPNTELLYIFNVSQDFRGIMDSSGFTMIFITDWYQPFSSFSFTWDFQTDKQF